MDEFIVINQNEVILNQYVKKLLNESMLGNFNFLGIWLGNNLNNQINKILKCEDFLNFIFYDINKLCKNEEHPYFDKNCKFNLWGNKNENKIVKKPYNNENELNEFFPNQNIDDITLIFHFEKVTDDKTIPNKLKSTRSEIIKRVENLEEILEDKDRNLNESLENAWENKLLSKDIEIEKLKKQILKERIMNQKYQNELLKQKYANLKLENKFLENNLSIQNDFMNTSNESIAAESFIQLGEHISNEDIPVAIEM